MRRPRRADDFPRPRIDDREGRAVVAADVDPASGCLDIRGLVVAVVVSASSAGDSGADSTVLRGPWLLPALPSIGTVTWRCDTTRERRGQSAVALGLDARRARASQIVSLSTNGNTVFERRVHPGQLVTLPFLRSAVQQLTVVQETKPGTLRGVVVVNFGPGKVSRSHCWEHFPPAVTVRVFPR